MSPEDRKYVMQALFQAANALKRGAEASISDRRSAAAKCYRAVTRVEHANTTDNTDRRQSR